jgi:hypothetical protein
MENDRAFQRAARAARLGAIFREPGSAEKRHHILEALTQLTLRSSKQSFDRLQEDFANLERVVTGNTTQLEAVAGALAAVQHEATYQ